MIESAIAAQTAATTRLADVLDRIADAMEAGAALATLEARVAALENKTDALGLNTPTIPVAFGAPATLKAKRAATLPEGKVAAPAKAPDPTPPAEQASAPEAPVEPTLGTDTNITHDTLRALGRDLIKLDGNPKRFKAIIAQHGADTISALPEDKFVAVAADIQALLQ